MKKKSPGVPEIERPSHQIAFILLDEARLPDASAVLESFERFNGESEVLSISRDEESGDQGDKVMMLDIEGIGFLAIALMQNPIPDQEAEHHLSFSLSALGGEPHIGAHSAHLMVSLMGIKEEIPPLRALMAFTSALAAVTEASPASAVYWGNGGATHPADFVLSVAEDHSPFPRVFLWNGLSRGSEDGEKISFLSRGMSQLGLPDLYMIAPMERAGDEVQRFYSYLAYLAERGEAIPDGDTIGSSDEERIRVRYIDSPADDGSVVWSIEV